MNFDRPHRRRNPLTGEWVLVSPQRATRPWLGQVEKTPQPNLPHYDPDCYLCPRNQRAGGLVTNPDYEHTFVFDNDFSALLPPETGIASSNNENLFQAEAENGLCRVICFSPRHDLSLPELEISDAIEVIKTWREETRALSALDYIQYVQIFENKGAVMGCSNPHPHSQIWATGSIPNEPQKEIIQLENYYAAHGKSLLADYLEKEEELGERVIVKNSDFIAVVPFWAVWPFEVLLAPRRQIGSLLDLTQEEIISLAEIMQQITIRYDNLFEVSFPYSMGFHQMPFNGKQYPGWHLHAHFYPPLLRSATVKKFMVGYEMLSMPQRDITPEAAAERLRETSPIHFTKQNQ